MRALNFTRKYPILLFAALASSLPLTSAAVEPPPQLFDPLWRFLGTNCVPNSEKPQITEAANRELRAKVLDAVRAAQAKLTPALRKAAEARLQAQIAKLSATSQTEGFDDALKKLEVGQGSEEDWSALNELLKAALTEAVAAERNDAATWAPIVKALKAANESVATSLPADVQAAKVDSGGVNFLQSASAKFGSEATQLSTELINAYAPLSQERCAGTVVGVKLSATTPSDATGAEAIGVARQSVLLSDATLLNFSLSLARTFSQRSTPLAPQTEDWRALRAGFSDRFYKHSTIDPGTADQKLWGYWLNGLAVKALKTREDLNSADSKSHYRAMGTFYLGYGIDGPLFTSTGNGVPAGGMDIQIRAAANVLNPKTMTELFGPDSERKSVFYTAGVMAKAYIYSRITAAVEYQTVIGGNNRNTIGDKAIFSLGFTDPKAPPKSETSTASTDAAAAPSAPTPLGGAGISRPSVEHGHNYFEATGDHGSGGKRSLRIGE